jgi:hypothetical protein
MNPQDDEVVIVYVQIHSASCDRQKQGEATVQALSNEARDEDR